MFPTTQLCILLSLLVLMHDKGGGTGGARGAIAPPLFNDHLKIINYSDTENGS